VHRGLAIPAEKLPDFLKHSGRRPSEPEKRRFLELQRKRDKVAEDLGIDPTLIASRAVLSDLAHNWDNHQNELMPWQRRLLAD
jgi:ribonuclease D